MLNYTIPAWRYGLDDPGIESRWGAWFSSTVQNGPGSHPASCLPGTHLQRRGVDHPPPSSVKVKERV